MRNELTSTPIPHSPVVLAEEEGEKSGVKLSLGRGRESFLVAPLIPCQIQLQVDFGFPKLKRVLRKLAEVLTKPLSIIYQQSWQAGKVPADWHLANVTPIHKKGRKDDPGNYRPVSLTSVPGKVMEQIILSAIMWHMKDNEAIRPSQHRFMKVKSCLTNLTSFYDKVIHFMDEGKAVDVVYLDFSKGFNTVSHSILLEKLAAHGFEKCIFHWAKNWLEGWSERVVVNGVKSIWWPVRSGTH
ncbi:rna-directed dna polymerase from mobile element jockey-like [Limosa lapponica baueri]|uniref:Rna-directed dna polymerase from mobile element jockey-like n=1 Tax=Limosa lapponica baueri TaxID=1758121 RepID=A0A2I0UA87_LIMLA|nr:rna-directed dna polymerase from mobile element jockey-like [Limosa lapponica baueri]